MIDSLLAKLADIAEIEYADVVIGCEIIEGKWGNNADIYFER